ncbi:MAG: ankyrin repeat domain-containing protein [Planctomycetota bacterium]
MIASRPLRRRLVLGGIVAGLTSLRVAAADDEPGDESKPAGPREAEFDRDYPEPGFKPSWRNPQVNRTLVSDFVIYAHSDLDMTRKLLEREAGLINAAMDWGNGDFETALGGASHMGRRDIVEFLLSKGARPDLLCAAMLGQLDVVKAMLNFEPKLIDAKGPHGFSLHFHAQVGGDQAQPVLDYLQSIKKVELRPVPFLKAKKKK